MCQGPIRVGDILWRASEINTIYVCRGCFNRFSVELLNTTLRQEQRTEEN
jgi:hypothetical protein